MTTKPALRSKTLWFNLLAGLGFIFGPTGALGHVFAPAEVGAVMGIGNILLRFFTDRGIVINDK